jgi:hypothetical protein
MPWWGPIVGVCAGVLAGTIGTVVAERIRRK